jgi:hypothetical protein
MENGKWRRGQLHGPPLRTVIATGYTQVKIAVSYRKTHPQAKIYGPLRFSFAWL